MLRCDFVRLVKEMDHRFKFYHRPDQYTNSSLWFLTKDGCEQEFVAGVPTDNMPEYTVIAKDEFIKDRGWRAVLRMILDKKLHGRNIVARERFWKVLRKHGIWSIDQYMVYETAWGGLSRKQSTKYQDFHRGR